MFTFTDRTFTTTTSHSCTLREGGYVMKKWVLYFAMHHTCIDVSRCGAVPAGCSTQTVVWVILMQYMGIGNK